MDEHGSHVRGEMGMREPGVCFVGKKSQREIGWNEESAAWTLGRRMGEGPCTSLLPRADTCRDILLSSPSAGMSSSCKAEAWLKTTAQDAVPSMCSE